MKLFKSRFEIALRKHSFNQRVIDGWNSLTENTVTAKSTNRFEEKLDKHCTDDDRQLEKICQ